MTTTAGIRLVFADMDDTFLARDKSLPHANLEALDLLAERGIDFVPCTGRPVTGIPQEVMAHPATRFAVGSNGGLVIDAKTGFVLRRQVMPTSLVTSIYHQVRDLDVTFDCFVPGHVLCERRRFEAMEHFGVDAANLQVIKAFREPHDATIPELIAGYEGVEKVTLYWSREADRDAARAALAARDEIDVTTSHPKNFEFMAHGTSKGSALTWLCAHVGIEAAQTVAFGDSANDLPMLVAAGDGVAMANASAEVRSQADHVCGNCDDGGLGTYLKELLA